MEWKRILLNSTKIALMTGGAIFCAAHGAHAATGDVFGVPSGWFGSTGMQDIGFGAGAAGAVGILTHAVSGHELPVIGQHAVKLGVGGAACLGYSTLAGDMGMTTAAIISTALNHPLVHHAIRLLA